MSIFCISTSSFLEVWVSCIHIPAKFIAEVCCSLLRRSLKCFHCSYERNSGVVKKHFTAEEAMKIGETLGIDWSRFGIEQYRMGLDVELEHGRRDPETDVTGDDPILTGKIALAHLKEFPDYYSRLERLEKEADEFWANKK